MEGRKVPKEKNMSKHLKPKYQRYKASERWKINTIQKLSKHIAKFPEDGQAIETLAEMKSGKHRFEHCRGRGQQ